MESRKLDHIYGSQVDTPKQKASFSPCTSRDLDLSIHRGTVCAGLNVLVSVGTGHNAHEVHDVH